MNHDPQISVIVPVYNSEKTVVRCIKSILAQSYTYFEILLINDGSSDRSGALALQLAETDKRIRIFHKSNGGVSSARNLGLRNAKGDYIVFVDSDDTLQRHCFERLIAFREHDVVLCSFETSPDNTFRKFEDQSYHSIREIGSCVLKNLYTGFSMPWAKLFKKSIVLQNNLFFDEALHSGEDTLWVSQYLLNVSSVRLISHVGYCYNRGEQGGLSTREVFEQVMHETVSKIVSSYNALDRRFAIDTIEWKLNVRMYFFHRYIMYLSRCKFPEIVQALKWNVESECFRPIFYDDVYVLKGKRLKLFNFLARNRWFPVLGAYVKVQKRYL